MLQECPPHGVKYQLDVHKCTQGVAVAVLHAYDLASNTRIKDMPYLALSTEGLDMGSIVGAIGSLPSSLLPMPMGTRAHGRNR